MASRLERPKEKPKDLRKARKEARQKRGKHGRRGTSAVWRQKRKTSPSTSHPRS
jgi:hypothetical protein